MGVFSKLKNIFYDEVEVDEPAKEIKIDKPVKKEIVEKPRVEEIKVVRQEEKREEPKREETLKENDNFGNERDLFRSERTFNFTQFDDDEIDLPPRRNVLEREKKVVKQEVKEPVVEQPKVFKPSPVISPIYGILDKDYKKEEIAPKKVEVKETTLSANTVNYDTVRRKAYGTLEDDLEDTLNKMNKLTPNDIQAEVQKIDSDVNKLEERSNKIEDLITKIESSPEMNKNVSVGELEDKVKLENFDDTTELSNDKTMTDSTLEHDLFNLIDSMYDDKED
ncbi:unknown [Clostridium sp. CAG:524]|nr:unknown [Clostridium sp. CAG:524]